MTAVFSAARPSLPGPRGSAVGPSRGLLNLGHDRFEMLTAGCLFGALAGAQQIDRGGHGSALGMPNDKNHLGAGDRTAILQAAQHILADHVAGDADAEYVPQPQVQD